MWRFLLGVFLGLLLAGDASWFIGVGHGTIVPFAFASSLLALMLELGPVIPSLGTPLLWGIYFLLIPDIDSRVKRFVVLFAVLGLHLLVGVLFYIDDEAGMERASGGNLISFFVLLLVSASLLILFSYRHPSGTSGLSLP